MPLLFIVEDVYEIMQRGPVAIGKLADPENYRFRTGDTVEIRRTEALIHVGALAPEAEKPDLLAIHLRVKFGVLA